MSGTCLYRNNILFIQDYQIFVSLGIFLRWKKLSVAVVFVWYNMYSSDSCTVRVAGQVVIMGLCYPFACCQNVFNLCIAS